MTANELIEALQALTPEQRNMPVVVEIDDSMTCTDRVSLVLGQYRSEGRAYGTFYTHSYEVPNAILVGPYDV